MITVKIQMGSWYPRAVEGDYLGCFLGATDRFLIDNKVEKIVASTRSFKGCSIARKMVDSPKTGLLAYTTLGENPSRVDLCDGGLKKLFGKVPTTIYYKLN